MGMDFNAGTGALGLGTKNLEGGRKGQVERKAKALEETFKTYEAKTVSSSQVARAAQYESDKKQAQDYATATNEQFDENEFKRDYEKGGSLMEKYRLDKTVEGGSVGSTAKEVTAYRRRTYADSLQEARAGETGVKGAMKNFFKDWAKEMNNAERGILAKSAIGITTLGTAQFGEGFLKALKGILSPRATDQGVIDALRKGEDPLKHALHELAKHTAAEGGHAEPAAGHSAPPATATPAAGHTPPPTTH